MERKQTKIEEKDNEFYFLSIFVYLAYWQNDG